jgi:hypothetical protein
MEAPVLKVSILISASWPAYTKPMSRFDTGVSAPSGTGALEVV